MVLGVYVSFLIMVHLPNLLRIVKIQLASLLPIIFPSGTGMTGFY
jgi:hypothetical protein